MSSLEVLQSLSVPLIRIFNRTIPIRNLGLRLSEAALVFLALVFACRAAMDQQLTLATAFSGEVAVLGGVILLCMYCFDTYEPQVISRRAHGLSRIVQAMGLTMLVAAAISHAWPGLHIDVPSVLLWMIILGVAFTVTRYLFAGLVGSPQLAEPAVIWGSGHLAESIVAELRKRPDVGIRIIGMVEATYANGTFAGVPYVGSPDNVWSMAASGMTSRLIVAIGERRGCLPVERLMALKAAGLEVEDGVQLYEELTGRVWLESFRVSSLLFSRNFGRSRIFLFAGRILSIFCAVILLVALTPVMLITAALIRLDSEGPAILRQKRVGKHGHLFTLFKFRSMKVGAEQAETLIPATEDDPRCTRIGRWIRRLRVDELPQLFNILKGDMSFVGPRPFVPDQEASLVRQIPHYEQRWAVLPGATGWAQVNRAYCASIEDNVEKLSYDLFYIKHRSIGLNIVTVLKTLKVTLFGRGGR